MNRAERSRSRAVNPTRCSTERAENRTIGAAGSQPRGWEWPARWGGVAGLPRSRRRQEVRGSIPPELPPGFSLSNQPGMQVQVHQCRVAARAVLCVQLLSFPGVRKSLPFSLHASPLLESIHHRRAVHPVDSKGTRRCHVSVTARCRGRCGRSRVDGHLLADRHTITAWQPPDRSRPSGSAAHHRAKGGA